MDSDPVLLAEEDRILAKFARILANADLVCGWEIPPEIEQNLISEDSNA